ncbi:penicillin-binding protein [Citrobacter koseri]|uniref:Penicillin-binding protein n=1 Tax=Citrobacter koseri TaxID=545 RepID=A0A2X2X6I4_CITKO|nr:penicillin-binding protein [Citrobacter koseri]
MKRSLLFSAVLCAASLTSVQAAQPITDPVFASDIVDRYANHIFYGSGATGMALVVIDGNQRVFRSFGRLAPAITYILNWTPLFALRLSRNS